MTLRRLPTVLGLAALLTTLACGPAEGPASITYIAPASPEIEPGGNVQFTANFPGTPDEAVVWSVLEKDGGTIDLIGNYTAPDTEGTYNVLASTKSLSTTDSTQVRVKRNIRVDVSPSSATLAAGQSLALTAAATGAVKTVTWSVAEAPEGGTVTAAGVYTAPQTDGVYNVVATSTADPSKSDSATITVTAPLPPPPPPPTVAIAVTPQTASVVSGSTVQFAATVTGSTDVGVTWAVAESGGGTVSTTGLYTAPAASGTYHVMAASHADSSKTASASITATAPPALSGVARAFPGAQGAGAASVGGRGGAVYEVTTLADSGTGSLRACVQATGPRTCVFRVAGNIPLVTPLIISKPYLTIAGQTAPGGGVTIDGRNLTQGMVGLYAHDVVIRYVRFRKGYNANTPYGTGTVFGIYYGAYKAIIDHCSISWGQDDALSTWTASGTPTKDLTFSWNMVYEGYAVHSTATITGASTQTLANGMTDTDYHHNMFANFDHRSPLYKNKSGRIVNNIIYNANNWSIRVGGGAQVDIISNRWKNGSMPMNVQEITVFPGGNSTTSSGSPSIYVAGNIGPHNPTDPNADNWTTSSSTSLIWEVSAESGSNVGALSTSYERASPLAAAGYQITAEAATNLETSMLPNVGASRRLDCSGSWVSMRDSADAKVINDYHNGTGSIPANSSTSVTWPTLAAGTPCTDTDHDGMPDTWETAHGLNPNDAADRNGTTVLPPYTNLEAYLAGN